MKGVLNLYKQKGMTSAAAVGRVRRILGERTVGHMGTLDPQGEGVLLLGVGKGARLFDHYLQKDKVYEAVFTFGYATDTLDGDGVVTVEGQPIPDASGITAALKAQCGTVDQMPPAYSAKSVGGVRAYKLARQGIDPKLSPKRVEIYDAELIEWRAPDARVRVHCSSGTYIRSICRDVAGLLHTAATMTAIKRTRCGRFYIEDAVTFERLVELGQTALIPVETALQDVPRVDVPEELYAALINGVPLDLDAPAGEFALYCKNELFGLARKENERVKIKTNLR